MSRSYQSSGDDGKDDVLNALKVKFTIPDSKMWRDKNRKRKVSAFLLPDGGGFTVYVLRKSLHRFLSFLFFICPSDSMFTTQSP